MIINDENLPILLGVESKNNKIKFRLDEDGLGNFYSTEKSIREIILSDCQLSEELFNRLQEVITEVFEYETFKRNDKMIFRFGVDYWTITEEIECGNVLENLSKYTIEDLIQKGSALYDSYVDLHKRCSKNYGINYQLREKLNFEIANEMERSKRKAEFFENTEKGKSETFQSEVKFLQKLQNILN